MNTFKTIVFALFIFPFLTSCSTDLGTFTIFSAKLIDKENFNTVDVRQIEDVEGGDLLVFNSALEDLYKKTDRPLFTNLTIYVCYLCTPPFTWLTGQDRWYFKGDALIPTDDR